MSPTTIPQFAQPLPTLAVAGGTMATLIGNQPLTIRMCEYWANVLPPGIRRFIGPIPMGSTV
jgi:hypothetical protein